MVTTSILGAFWTCSAAAVPVLAQAAEPAPEGPRWIAVVFALLITVCIVLASIKSSKRTHQD